MQHRRAGSGGQWSLRGAEGRRHGKVSAQCVPADFGAAGGRAVPGRRTCTQPTPAPHLLALCLACPVSVRCPLSHPASRFHPAPSCLCHPVCCIELLPACNTVCEGCIGRAGAAEVEQQEGRVHWQRRIAVPPVVHALHRIASMPASALSVSSLAGQNVHACR